MDSLAALEAGLAESSTPKKPRVGKRSESVSGSDRETFTSPKGTEDKSTASSKSKPCVGCSRKEGSLCTLSAGGSVAWAFRDNSGCWCRDCFNIWRTAYGSQMSLTLFSKWVVAPENRLDFFLKFLAFISLKAGGEDKVTLPMLAVRTEALRFFAKALGWPLEPTVVVPLAQFLRENGGQLPLPDHLITMKRGTENCLGVLVRSDPDIQSNTAKGIIVERPGGFLPLARPLLSDLAGDAAALGDHGHAANLQLVAISPGTVPQPNSDTTGGTKVQMRLASQRATASSAVRVFASEGWATELKESAFTVPLKGMLAVLSEANAVGDEIAGKSAQIWVDGLAACKALSKSWREYVKSRHNHSRFVQLSPKVCSVFAFAVSQHLPLHVDFRLCKFKCAIFVELHEMDGLRLLAPCFEKAFQDGLAEILRAKSSSEGASSGTDTGSPTVFWLRHVVFLAYSECLASWNVKSWCEDCELVLSDIERVSALVADLTFLQGEALASLSRNLYSVKCVVSASCKLKASACDTNDAIKQMCSAPLMTLLDLADSDTGKLILKTADGFVQKGAKDDLGDARFGTGMMYLEAPSLLAFKPSAEGVCFVMNGDTAINGDALGVLRESLDAILEAVESWSVHRREEQTQKMGEYCERLTTLLQVVDLACSLFVANNLRRQVFLEGLILTIVHTPEKGGKPWCWVCRPRLHMCVIPCVCSMSGTLVDSMASAVSPCS